MKNLVRYVYVQYLIASVTLFTVAVCIVGLIQGCTTRQQTTAYKTVYSLEASTLAAYDGYLASIVHGQSSTNALPTVAKSFNDFQAAAKLSLDTVQFSTNAIAPASLVIEAQDFVNLINTVKGK